MADQAPIPGRMTSALPDETAAVERELRAALRERRPIQHYVDVLYSAVLLDMLDGVRTELAQLTVETGRVLAERGEEISALTAERDRLRQREAWRMTRTYDAMAAELSQVTTERNRLAREVDALARQVRDVRDYADTIEEVEGGAGWEAIVSDLRGIVGWTAAARAAAEDAAWDDAVEATAQAEDGAS